MNATSESVGRDGMWRRGLLAAAALRPLLPPQPSIPCWLSGGRGRPVALSMLLMLAFLASLSAPAQAQVVAVSNSSLGINGTRSCGNAGDGCNATKIAQAFRTGTNTDGYVVASIALTSYQAGWTASLHDVDADLHPTGTGRTLLVASSGQTLVPASGDRLVLDPSTHYAVVISGAFNFRETWRGGRLDRRDDCVRGSSGYNSGQCVETADGWRIAPKYALFASGEWEDIPDDYAQGKGASLFLTVNLFEALTLTGGGELVVRANPEKEFQVSWPPVPDDGLLVDGWRWRYKGTSETDAAWTTWTEIQHPGRRHDSGTGVTQGTSYDFELQAKDGRSGYGWYWSVVTSGPPRSVPSTPVNLSAAPKHDGTVDLSWDAATDATDYQVRWKRCTTPDWYKWPQPDELNGRLGHIQWGKPTDGATEINIEGRQEPLKRGEDVAGDSNYTCPDGSGFKYEFQVVAYNAEDRRGFEAAATATPNISDRPVSTDGPAAPGITEAEGREGHVVLRWDAPAMDPDVQESPVTDYEIKVTSNGHRVRGGDWFSVDECRSWRHHLNDGSDTRCNWSMKAPAENAPLTCESFDPNAHEEVTPACVDETSYVVDGLRNGVTYSFEVRAINEHGAGESSEARNATPVTGTFTEVPQQHYHCHLIGRPGNHPSGLAPQDTPRTADGWEFRCFWLAGSRSYTAGALNAKGYALRSARESTQAGDVISRGVPGSLSHGHGEWEITRATRQSAQPLKTPGHISELQATPDSSQNGGQNSVQSNGSGRLQSMPEARQQASPEGGGRIDLLWTPTRPASTHYDVEWSTDGEIGWQDVDPPDGGGDTAYSHTGLTARTTYHYRVRGMNEHGEGEWARASATTGTGGTGEPAPEPPAPPTEFVAADVTESTVELSWTAPEGEITGYEVERSTGDGGEWTPVDPAHGGTEPQYSDTGLEAETAYSYRVRATNAAGASEWSDTASATTLAMVVPADLTAEFQGMPDSHDGEGEAFTFRVLFSDEDVDVKASALRGAFIVQRGRVTRATRVNRRDDLREITVEPDSDEPVRIKLPVTTDCGHAYAVCTSDGRKLSNALDETVAGPDEPEPPDPPEPENTPATGAPTINGTPQVEETLTASTSGISDEDGLSGVRYEYQWIRGGSDIGATGSSYTLVDADEGQAIKVRVDFTDDAGFTESLTSAATDPVEPAPLPPLTASFADMPDEHEGNGTTFTFTLSFSEDVEGLSYKTLRDSAFEVDGGSVTRSKRLESGRNQHWTVHVKSSTNGTVSIRLPAGAVQTADGRALENSNSDTVIGPPAISVSDARVEEAAGAAVAFPVTLSRPAAAPVTVDYATRDGSARAGDDYTATSGTLTFQAGESSRTIEVGVLDDAHDEGEETFVLALSNASGAWLDDAEATGTIENADLMPAALLARFGRATAEQVVQHVEERMAAPRNRGFRARLAGREVQPGMERDVALGFLSQLAGPMGAGRSAGPMGAASMGGGPAGAAPMAMGRHTAGPAVGAPGAVTTGTAGAMGTPPGGATAMTGQGASAGMRVGGFLGSFLPSGGLFSNSEFELNREQHGGILSVWSRSSRSYFSGMEDALSLNGDVRTTMLGADYRRGPLTVGLSVGRTLGLGGYGGRSAGRMTTAMTGFYPWVGYQLNDRVSVWGVTGYGTGALSLTPAGQAALETGMSMAMAAVGTRGELVGSRATGGFALAFKADTLWVGAASELLDGPAGRLNASEAGVTRVRAALEGSPAFTLGGRVSLMPSVEVGLRQDGGDAETGAGMDIAGGLVFTDTVTGLSLDVRARTLVVHQAEGFTERGMSLSLGWNPTPSSPLGLTARISPSWGGQATGGAEALWQSQMAYGAGAHQMYGIGGQVNAEVGYGLPVGTRFVGTPRVGYSASPYGRDYRVGYTLSVLDSQSLRFEVGVDAQRRESPLGAGFSNGALATATVGW